MEFGKKGDAKKAMQLMWDKNISLKEAWKQVQKKQSYKKRKATSPKKRKAVSNAKKAMQLMWDKDISLKEAWKQVQKKSSSFGMGPCPQGFEPNKRYTAGKGQRVCIKECKFYQMRNPETNRCKNMTMVKPMIIPDNYEIGPTGKLRKICPPGKYRDPETGRCKKIKTVLKPLAWNLKFGDASQLSKGSRGHHMFGKKCGFGSCSSCAIN